MALPQNLIHQIPKRKPQKGLRNRPNIYAENKSPRSISLTDMAIEKAESIQARLELSSRSEAIEVVLRLFNALPDDAIAQAIVQTFMSNTSTDEPEKSMSQ